MLNKAIKHLKAGDELDLNASLVTNQEINLHTPMILTQTYCPNTNERLVIYKRFSSCKSQDDLSALKEELIDRFGLMPEQTNDLVTFHKLRIDISSTEIIKIDSNKKSTEITFQKNANIDPIKLIELIQSDHRFKMNGPDKIKILLEEENITKRVMFITKKIKELKV